MTTQTRAGNIARAARSAVQRRTTQPAAAVEGVILGGEIDAASTDDESATDAAKNSIDPEMFARQFLQQIARLQSVHIDRRQYLATELAKHGVDPTIVLEAVNGRPAAAGVPRPVLDDIALEAIAFETRKSSALSFAAGLPGGFAMLATIPGDVTQYYVHAFRIMQKLAYVYGWDDFLEDCKEIDDETLGLLAAFLGVMLGVGGANTTLATFAKTVAQPAIQKNIARQTLTKTSYYPVIKQTLKLIGIKVTKDSFAKGISKAVPVVGGVVSAGVTFGSLRVSSKRLMGHLRTLPQARTENGDAEPTGDTAAPVADTPEASPPGLA